MTFEQFLTQTGILKMLSDPQTELISATPSIVSECFAEEPGELSDEEVLALYEYEVPPEGPCDVYKPSANLQPETFNLADFWRMENDARALREHPHTTRLWRLNQIMERMNKIMKSHWLGVYQAFLVRDSYQSLIKEAYQGYVSRADFPLTEQFAAGSNNSMVGMTGKAVLFNDIVEYDGPYYQCSEDTSSEFCCPIISADGEITGIIDCEDNKAGFYDDAKVLLIARACYDLGRQQRSGYTGIMFHDECH